MGSKAKKFVIRSSMVALILSVGYLVMPECPTAQGPPEAALLEQKAKEDARVLRQMQRESALARAQEYRRQRLATGLAMLLVRAKAQNAMLVQWQKTHSSEYQTKARVSGHKKRLH